MQVTPLYTAKGKNIPMTVTPMLISTVFFRPHRFMALPTGIPRNRNQMKTIDGTNPVIVEDHPNVR